VSGILLPPAPCADAGEERFLLDAVRFLVAQRMFSASPAAVAAEAAEADAYPDIQDKAAALADIGFFLNAQLRAAEARGQPLHEAFSFSGRTLASVTRLAAEHRREALVAAVPATGGRFRMAGLAGEWRGHALPWDAECERMLALRGGVTHVADRSRCANLSWPADVQLARARNSDRRATTTLHGVWRMVQLRTMEAIRKEGKEQDNCLRYQSATYLNFGNDGDSYWSLRFTPDAAGQAQLKVDTQLRCSMERLRLTVEVQFDDDDGASVLEALAAHNKMPPLAAEQALEEWGRRAGVHVSPDLGDDDDEDDDEEEEEEDEDAWEEEDE
jgi:hypothetical protein